MQKLGPKKKKRKEACQVENPKRQSRQKLGSKKKKKRKEACQAENPKRQSRQKLGLKKRKGKENPTKWET